MTFINTMLAFGAVACAIPLIIHLLNRSKHKVIQWGAMHLLEPVIRVNRKRIRLEQLILLMVRMLILSLLAFCMAGPVLTGCSALSGNAKTSLVMLFDNSYSMEAGAEAGGESHFARAKKQAAEVLEHQPRGSDVAMILTAGSAVIGTNAPTSDLERANEELSELDSGFGASDIGNSFESGAKALARMQNAKRDVVIVSDFQAADWGDATAPGRARAMEMIRSMPLQPSITLIPVGNEVNDNIAIDSVELSRFVVGIGQEFQIRANIRNLGEQPYPALRVYFKVDGKDRDSSELDLGPGEDGQVLFRHTFDEAGSHLIEVMADADSLEADNKYQVVVPVWDRIPVVLVNGDPHEQPLKGETDFLQLALSPFMAVKDAGNKDKPLADLLEAATIETNELHANALVGKRVAVLANVPRLTDQQLKAIETFVRDGNALLVFPGNRIDSQWYNQTLVKRGKGILPLQMTELESRIAGAGNGHNNVVEVALKPEKKDTKGVGIVAQHYDHPALAMFNDPRNGNLGEGEITAFFRLSETTPSGSPDLSVTVLARLATGDPLLVEKKFGRGRVIQCATSCDDAWSNLPARPFYLPLMQRLVTYLAASVEPSRNLATGETLVANLPKDAAGKKAAIVSPEGKRLDVMVRDRGSHGVVEYTGTDRPGVYTLEANNESTPFVVNTNRNESVLTRLDEDELKALAETMDATLVTSATEYTELDSTRRYGRDIWREVFWMLLILMFGELLIQQYFTRRRA